MYVRQIDAITGSTHPRIECVLYIEMTPPTALVLSLSLVLSTHALATGREEAATSTAAPALSWRLDEDDDGVDYAAVMTAPTSTYNGHIFKLMAQLFRLLRRFSDYLH